SRTGVTGGPPRAGPRDGTGERRLRGAADAGATHDGGQLRGPGWRRPRTDVRPVRRGILRGARAEGAKTLLLPEPPPSPVAPDALGRPDQAVPPAAHPPAPTGRRLPLRDRPVEFAAVPDVP